MATSDAAAGSSAAISWRRLTASWAIFPLHKTIRRTVRGSATSASSSTCAKEPVSRSSIGDREACARSIDLGVTTIKGRFGESKACERSKWKYWAEVDGTATRMFPRAQRERNRSKREDEC